MNTPVESTYRRWEGTFQILTLILVPLVICFVGYALTYSVERTRISQEYISQAIAILSEEIEVQPQSGVSNVTNLDPAKEAMRTWAVAILDRYSPIPLSAQQKQSLISGEAVTVIRTTDYYSYSPLHVSDQPESQSPSEAPPGQ